MNRYCPRCMSHSPADQWRQTRHGVPTADGRTVDVFEHRRCKYEVATVTPRVAQSV